MANRKIAYTLGRGRAYIFDMSSTSGYMGEKYVQEFGPRFLACLDIFGVPCSKCCVSWRVDIYRVNKFRVMSCQNPACQRVHAMSTRGHPVPEKPANSKRNTGNVDFLMSS